MSEGVSANTTLNIFGGLGDDSFTVYRNAGALNLEGDAGNDTFVVRGFEPVEGEEK